MIEMRAKLKLEQVDKQFSGQETLTFNAVCANHYPEDGSDENNTYAKFTPTASLRMCITNPSLLDKFKVGDVFYLDFTKTK
jgi:hypothetical protein